MTPEQVFAPIAHRPGAVWLDGGAAPTGWSILAWDPTEVRTDGTDWPAAGRGMVGRRVQDAPFSGGCIGYLGFGAGHRVEVVPTQADTVEPEIWLGRYRGGLCYRHRDQTWHPAGEKAFQDEARALLASAKPLSAPPPPPVGPTPRTTPRDRYEAAIETLLAYITDGDCYQVNLSRPVFLEGVGAPWPAYRRLRALSAPAYGAFLRIDTHLAVLSNSPELFLTVRGDQAVSEPVKGTRARHAQVQRDHALAEALRRSPKDRAELTMIVDLVRNDLGRVAIAGTVSTTERTITTHAHVHHAAQRVSATLRPGFDAWDALAASFPPGSVTGAPKIRACERIRQLEETPRGVYCGAIGYTSDGGNASWSVAIRTAIWHRDTVRYHVGGGIVAASEASEEWAETEAKGLALAAALHAPKRSRPSR